VREMAEIQAGHQAGSCDVETCEWCVVTWRRHQTGRCEASQCEWCQAGCDRECPF
jgi:hypothetical protein